MSSSTPFIGPISYLLVGHCVTITFLSLPSFPLRRLIVEKISRGQNKILNHIRFCYIMLHVFILLLFIDDIRRMNYLKEQVGRAYKNERADSTTLQDFSKRLHKAQRDFYILIFTLFCAVITYLLHLLVLKMENYRVKYLELKEMYNMMEKKSLELADQLSDLKSGKVNNKPTEEPLPEYSVEDKNNLTKRNNTTKKDE
ncbi:hypothetical protein H8356DRAFT_1652988 [Neocallimastix lanati (nom. inval.)]|jgi:hypothetical protein|uniref:Endoplasmic reticulum transmembrane protein n=1 Tax=Neocallimastix californiae TaxID=1754190 RepID=A0A1Y2F1T9_9FUNG|nr:hypothetical protein H8356DRAFT_1652988 [Neocallimastix sp. JGI-2020a]ORY77858.1 hypothetical protein LY90DRAFT_698408 [Neocallimastix californiae]|eukprot:ORY77858.1 hypothetical protein LY90DRAFT_698408 [Neocallimastix californiae]